MAQVSMSSDYNVSPEKVWDLIGKFHALPDWHPAVENSDIEEGGQVRRLHLVGGGEIVERLEPSNDDERVYRYSIMSSPLPVINYAAEIRVTGEGDSATVQWSSTFDPAGVGETDAMKVIEGIYQAGFDNLKKMFGG